jgi:hypothetical protein
MNPLQVTFLVPKFLRLLQDFWRIFAPLVSDIFLYRLAGNLLYPYPHYVHRVSRTVYQDTWHSTVSRGTVILWPFDTCDYNPFPFHISHSRTLVHGTPPPFIVAKILCFKKCAKNCPGLLKKVWYSLYGSSKHSPEFGSGGIKTFI